MNTTKFGKISNLNMSLIECITSVVVISTLFLRIGVQLHMQLTMKTHGTPKLYNVEVINQISKIIKSKEICEYKLKNSMPRHIRMSL